MNIYGGDIRRRRFDFLIFKKILNNIYLNLNIIKMKSVSCREC